MHLHNDLKKDLSEMQHLVQRFLILPALPGLLTQPLDRALSDRTKTCQIGGVTVTAILISHLLYSALPRPPSRMSKTSVSALIRPRSTASSALGTSPKETNSDIHGRKDERLKNVLINFY